MEQKELEEERKLILSSLIDLYLNVKVRSAEEIDNYTADKLEEERVSLHDTSPVTLVEYIKTSVEILMNMRSEEQALIKAQQDLSESFTSNASRPEPPKIYEEQIQKLEAEVRSHIRLEQQLKVHIDSMQDREEELERSTDSLTKEIKKLKEKNENLQNELSKNCHELEQLAKRFEEKKNDISRLEVQLSESERLKSDLERELNCNRCSIPASSNFNLKPVSEPMTAHKQTSVLSCIKTESKPPYLQNPCISTGKTNNEKVEGKYTNFYHNSSTNHREEYQGLSSELRSLSKGRTDHPSLKDLQKQIIRATTPYLQDPSRSKPDKPLCKNANTVISHLSGARPLAHIRSKSHKSLDRKDQVRSFEASMQSRRMDAKKVLERTIYKLGTQEKAGSPNKPVTLKGFERRQVPITHRDKRSGIVHDSSRKMKKVLQTQIQPFDEL